MLPPFPCAGMCGWPWRTRGSRYADSYRTAAAWCAGEQVARGRWLPFLRCCTDMMVALEGSEAFREVVWVLIEEVHRDGWHIGGQPSFGPPTLMSALGRPKAVYEAIDASRPPRGPGRPGPCSPPATRRGHMKSPNTTRRL
jgi:hypothetical protein